MAGRTSRATRLDPAVPWLLLFGGLAVGVGWLLGAVLLVRSPTWTARDKALGLLVLPLGLAPAVAFAASIGGGSCPPGGTAAGCGQGAAVVASALALFFLVTAPVTVAAWLAHVRRTQRDSDQV